MTGLLIVVDGDRAGDVERLLERHGLPGYTEIPNVLGAGASGRKFGTRAFPGSSSLYVAVVPRPRAAELVDALRGLRAARGPAEGLKVYAVNAEELL